MIEKHTKGMWHVEYKLDENKEKTDTLFVCHPETSCDMTTIANITNILATPEENKANAYLISAAPELLETLEKVTARLIEVGYQELSEVDKACRAITKAKGLIQ